ncbi:MAG: hypothetical protein PVG35_01455 [Desulfobacterales bacterium]
MKILENLWQVGGSGVTAAEDAAVYLIRFEHQGEDRKIYSIIHLAD